MEMARKCCPSDVSDEEWALVAPYLILLPKAAGQRNHPLREVFNGLRTILKTGAPWRWMPNDPPPWAAVYQQAQRWLASGCFEALADDLRAVLRLAAGRAKESSAASSTAAPCGPHPKAGSARAMTEPSARGLRAIRQHAGRPSPHRLRLPHVETRRSTGRKFITVSRP